MNEMLEKAATAGELRRLGYELVNPTRCKGCEMRIAWWRTPGGLFVPFEQDGRSQRLHYLDCPTKTPACFERMRDYERELGIDERMTA
jgi:hypothetical protein